MKDAVTVHVRDETVYADIGCDCSIMSTASEALLRAENLLEFLKSDATPLEGICMGATTRATLYENENVTVRERPFRPRLRALNNYHLLDRPYQATSSVRDSARRSLREFDQLDSQSVFDLLAIAVAIQSFSVDESGFVRTFNPSPSAGARHPVGVVIVSERPLLAGSDQSDCSFVSQYDAAGHGIWIMSGDEAEPFQHVIERATDHLGSRPPFVLVLTVAPWRTLSKYPNATSYLFMDAGAQLAILQQAACSLGLASCPLSAACLALSEGSPGLEAEFPVVALAVGGKVPVPK